MAEFIVNAVDAPKRWQWESSSGTPTASQSNNCGPTCITFIAGYKQDRNFGIEDTRRLVTGCCAPTTSAEQTEMLIARGVKAESIWIDSLAQIDSMIGNGERPIVIGIQMSRVPASVRDHPFLGWHAVVIMAPALHHNVPGYWVLDPNFSPPGGYRIDPDRGRKFYSRQVLYYAYIQNTIRRGIAPLRAKANFNIGGEPVDYTNEAGKAITILAGKPLRIAAHLSARSLGKTGTKRTMKLWASTVEGQPVSGSRKWFYGSLYLNGKHRPIYIPKVDAANYRSL